MEELEKHLGTLCAEDSRLRLLEAQWEYDKRLVQQALQTVGTTFPHYSLHDASHSNTILVNITRVLGDRVRRLSATDTWLLLEAAYWHDVGMVVSDAAIRSWWPSPEFQAHMRNLRESEDPLLAAAASLLANRTSLAGLGDTWPLDVRQALVFVTADYARKRHPVRSAEAIRTPLGYGIDSPRVLIPARLFEWLARICLSHGLSRDDVFELPQSENGISGDQCHPRFVACMLRLGDLLDLDNGRFCPVLLASIGRIPPSSIAHIGKHAAITRFYAGPDRVDVEATCHSTEPLSGEAESSAYRTYNAVSQWLEWLKDELTHLAVKWSDIAPDGLGGGPPSIGKIVARLKGYELLPSRTTPDFDVDSEYFLGLSKSSGLFGSPQHAWQRELITNAVDATLLRIWQTENQASRDAILASDDPIAKLRATSAAFPIKITIEPSPEKADDTQQRRWAITISDSGCGIGLEDLRSLQVVGSSSKNLARQRAIARLPLELLKPTGSFGLGFQSVFLDTERVEVTTHHLATRTSRRIVLTRASQKRGIGLDDTRSRSGVYIEPLAPAEDGHFEPGTTIKFTVERPASFGASGIKDPVLPEADLPDDSQWRQEIATACGAVPVSVVLNGKPLEASEMSDGMPYFDRESSMRITFLRPVIDSEHPSITWSYRGSTVTQSGNSAELLSYAADLYRGNASDILQVSRTSFTTRGSEQFQSSLKSALPVALEKLLKDLRERGLSDDDWTRRASFVAHAEYSSKVAGDEWRALELPWRAVGRVPKEHVKVGEFLANDTVTLLCAHSGLSPHNVTVNTPIPGDDCFMIGAPGARLLMGLVRDIFKDITWSSTIGPIPGGYVMTFVDVIVARKGGSATTRVEDAALLFSMIPALPGRHMLPCPAAFDGLAVNDQLPNWVKSRGMLSPFVVEGHPFGRVFKVRIEHLDRYVEHVVAKRLNQSVDPRTARADVARLTGELIEKADAMLRGLPPVECLYDVAAAKRTLQGLAG